MKTLAAVLLLVSSVCGVGVGVGTADTIAITGATVYPKPDTKLEDATVVIRDGKIVDVGKVGNVAIPAGAKVIDGKGKTVTAGLVEASSQLGLIEIDLEASGNDGRFGTERTEVHAAYRASDAFDGRSVAIPIARGGGVTSAVVGPRGALIAGQAAWVSLSTNAIAPVKNTVAMQAALGRGASAMGSRGYAIERLRELFDDVDAYRKNRAGFDRNQSRRLIANRLDLEALIPVLDGRTLLVIGVDAEVDIRAALAIAAERRLKIAIAGGDEAWRVAKELAAAKVAVMLDPTSNLPGNLAAADVRDDNATILAKAGVRVAISTLGGTSMTRTIRQLAGIAVANGLSWADGLASITTVPAKLYGVDRGTLARGAVADVVVWSGDPLELSTRAETVIIGGVVQSLESHQTRLRDRYRTLPK
ncbi:MAG: amidohydrolase family protein [Deltaproteobacteria bacterium]|nr:amidohydrolase family protein [Deltaproteobacteria bacterium]